MWLFVHHVQEQGMSGGQQNKDEEVVKMVARMNELKEKQACHSCDSKGLRMELLSGLQSTCNSLELQSYPQKVVRPPRTHPNHLRR